MNDSIEKFRGDLPPETAAPVSRSFLRRPMTQSGRARGGGFTLIEVLATVMLLAIVLPAVMKGISAASGAASIARQRTEASGLAEAKLAELVTTGTWQGGVLSGDFGADAPDYRWQATVQAWPQDTTTAGLQEIDLRVTWPSRGAMSI